ncbi:MAG: AraC family transcriptional regulator [Oscillospiraceae bacterium]|jgi:AraC-like DNA-binding protein|nr:AraC family transcriptional regulator [Oscillospiraceae bacterium]
MTAKKKARYKYYEVLLNFPIVAQLEALAQHTGNPGIPHFHNCLEIGYCFDGYGEIIIGENSYSYTKKSFSVIPQNCLHDIIPAKSIKNHWEYLFVDTAHFISPVYTNNPKMSKNLAARINRRGYLLHSNKHKTIASLILNIMDLYRKKGEMYQECAKDIMAALMIQVARLTASEDQDREYENSSNMFITNALNYIGENFKYKIQISDIARACHLSETHFRRLFRQSMNMSPLAYLNLVRIEASCKMLRLTNASIQDIAMNCGFDTLPTFNRNFQKIMNASPQQWRKEGKL